MNINKDTLLFGSFSISPGNTGCTIFNKCFQYYNIDAIYKSFKIVNILDAINAAKCLHFNGFAVSMPFKTEIIQYLDIIDDTVKKTNSCNTVLIKNNKLYGYNTDYDSIKNYILNYTNNLKTLYILGNGSYSHTLQFICNELNIQYTIITRNNWNDIKNIKNSYIFNCTPIDNTSIIDNTNIYIDCIPTTNTGYILALKQASIQFELYTSKPFPIHLFI